MKPETRAPKHRNGAAPKLASRASTGSGGDVRIVGTISSSHKQPMQPAADLAGGLAVVYSPLQELKLDPNNPRKHSPRQIRQIARSIDTFGFNVAVLVDANHKVIAGHGRVRAAQLLGRTHVPTIRLDHLTDAQARAFMIADNRLTENSTWDERILAEQFQQLSELNLDFSLDVTGFEVGEIDFRIESLAPSSEGQDSADVLPAVHSGPAVSRAGDLWRLGQHRVFCANSIERSSLSFLMRDERAHMGFTDPPYNLRIDGNVSGLGAIRHREFTMGSGEMTEAEFISFLTRALSLLRRHSRPGSLHFVFMDWRHILEIVTAGRQLFGELKNLCIWVKDHPGMGSLYRSQHELIFVFKHRGKAHRNNIQLGKFGRNRSNVWNYPCANTFSRTGDEGNLLALHPTVKPVALVADAILDCTSRGEIVLDSFLGSGTTVIAAERTGRRCYGTELDPLYVDTIVRRWEAFTQKDAIHEASGRSFKEVESERGKG